ncbi:MAG: HAMP domain-containing sensor histidine kinase [Planctomycetota bacterium]
MAGEERSRLEHLAAANAAFLGTNSLPLRERLASDLQRVTDCTVAFRRGAVIDAAAGELRGESALATAPADGAARRSGDLEVVAAPLGDERALVLARPAATALLGARIAPMVGAFLLLAGMLAWLAIRGLVQPLRGLAAQLPRIGADELLAVPGTQRPDEIGEVARAFERTRAALVAEREQRARMEKLAVLGRMSASLAHEIQNPVSAILMHAQLLRGTAVDDAAAVIEGEARRIGELVNQWMFTSRPEPPRLGEADLGQLLGEVVAALRPRLDHARVTVEVVAEGDLRLRCDGRRLHHVFANILTNALQAMPHGGRVAIRATGHGDAIAVAVRDRGEGFSATALARFGEYFFSEREGGMGIGLGVAQAIVAAHRGTLAAANAPEGGAVVTVTLPRVPPGEVQA